MCPDRTDSPVRGRPVRTGMPGITQTAGAGGGRADVPEGARKGPGFIPLLTAGRSSGGMRPSAGAARRTRPEAEAVAVPPRGGTRGHAVTPGRTSEGQSVYRTRPTGQRTVSGHFCDAVLTERVISCHSSLGNFTATSQQIRLCRAVRPHAPGSAQRPVLPGRLPPSSGLPWPRDPRPCRRSQC